MGSGGKEFFHNAELLLPGKCGVLSAVIQREPQATEESHRWFHRGNDDVLLCASLWDSTACGL